MARRLELDISGDSKDAAAALALAAKNVDHLAHETDRLQREFKQAERAAEGLDRQLLQTKAATAALAREFSKTGDKGIKKELDAQRVAAKELQKLRADIIGDTERDAKAAERAWQKAANEYRRLMRKSGSDGADTFAQFFEGGVLKALANPKIAAAAGVVGAGLAVQIGAIIGGAVIAGAATGAVGLGVAGAASQSKAVGDAWSEQIERLKLQFFEASQSFVGPTIDAAREFGDVMDHIRLDKILGTAAGYFSKLVAGASAFSRYVAAGFEALVENAGPVIDVIAEELPDLGLAIKMFSEDIAQGSEGGASALKDLLDVIEGVIVGTGRFIHGAENAYDAIMRFSEGARDLVDKLRDTNGLLYVTLAPADLFGDLLHDDADKAERFGAAMSGVSRTVADFGSAATTSFYNTADAARSLDEAFNRLFNEAISVDEANLRVNEGLLRLKETLAEGKRTLDTTTEAGQSHVRGILDQIRALEDKRQADIAAGNGTKEATDKANAAYAGQIQSLRNLLVQMGYLPAEVDKLLAKYREIPAEITTTIITRYKTVGGVEKGVYDPGDREDRRYGGARAGGGPVRAGMSYIVGDGGRPEVFFPGVNGYVAPSLGAAARMVGGWGGGTPVTVNVYGSVVTDRQLVEVIESTVSRLGGSPTLLGIK